MIDILLQRLNGQDVAIPLNHGALQQDIGTVKDKPIVSTAVLRSFDLYKEILLQSSNVEDANLMTLYRSAPNRPGGLRPAGG
jgi:hypothetical protein